MVGGGDLDEMRQRRYMRRGWVVGERSGGEGRMKCEGLYRRRSERDAKCFSFLSRWLCICSVVEVDVKKKQLNY